MESSKDIYKFGNPLIFYLNSHWAIPAYTTGGENLATYYSGLIK